MSSAHLSVRIDADLKRRLKVRLAEDGTTLAAWVEQAVRAYVAPPERQAGS